MFKKFKKIIAVVMFFAVMLSACVNESEKVDTAEGVNLTREGSKVVITPQAEVMGIEYLIDTEIEETTIQTLESDTFVVVTKAGDKTLVSVASKEGKIPGIVLINAPEVINVKSTNQIGKLDLAVVKKSDTAAELLGDFNGDNTVGIADFNMFKANYGGTDMTYDIGPATKCAEGYYAYASPDGSVGLFDLLVFAENYGYTVNPSNIDLNITISEWSASTEVIDGFNYGYVDLKLVGTSNADKIEVLTHGDGVEEYIVLDTPEAFNQSVGIAFTAFAESTPDQIYSTEIKAYKDGEVKVINLSSDEIGFGIIGTVSSVEIQQTTTTINVGDTKTLIANVYFYGIDTVSTEVDSWESSNTSIATVSANGLVTAIKEGTVDITAERDGKEDTITLTIEGGVTGITVHQKDYANIWAWDADGSDKNYFTDAWPGRAMTDADGDGWKDFTFEGVSTIQLLFNNGTNDKTGDLSISEQGEYWYKGGKLYSENPEMPYPVVTINPEGGYFENSVNAKVTVEYVTGSTDGNAEYKVYENGVVSKTGECNSGDTITAGASLAEGDTVKIEIIATATNTSTGKTLTTTSTANFTKGSTPEMKRLGAVYSKSSTTFAIWSPDTSNVKVVVDGTEYACTRVDDFDGYTNVYGVSVAGDLHLKEYQFKINGKAVRDPYGVMVKDEAGTPKSYIENGVTVTSDTGSNTNIVLDLSLTDLANGWAARPALVNREDAIIYEVHVGDFTSDVSSGVSSEKRGKFLGMVEEDTTYSSVATGIAHLKELGVTHVQLMPVYDFATKLNTATGQEYNWGYDPVNFNVPEERYATDSSDYVNRVKEFKMMVDEFHKNDIRVIMDVVYNHTFWDEMFENITDQYYDGLNLSGCGNSVDSGNAMVSRFIRDSLEYWVSEYNIDGFRFDLVGIFYVNSFKEWGEYLNAKYPERNILMYGEPWNGYATDPNEYSKVRLGNVANAASGHVGVFNGKYREDIKGDNDKTGRGYMFNVGELGNIEIGMRGAIGGASSDMWTRTFAADPEQSINYISAHDNYCLWDKIKHCGENNVYGQRVLKFGVGMVLTSQGIPFIHAGDEMLRTKQIGSYSSEAHNSYMWGSEMNNIYWNWKVENAAIFEYHKDLLALRKAHPGLRYTTASEINSYVKTYQTGRAVVMETDDNKDGTKDLVVVFNAGDNINVSLPSGSWTKIFDITGAVNATDTTCEGTAVTVFKRQ